VAFLVVAVYGCLVPLHFRPLPLEEALDRYGEAMGAPLSVVSRSDWAANILLFMPMGFLLCGALAVDRPRGRAVLAALVAVPACACLSAAIEFTQLYFPPRVTSINDVAANTLGGLLGSLVWLGAGQYITHWARQVWGGRGDPGLAGRLLAGYLFVLALSHALPLDLTISPAELYHKYREGRVRVVPFAGVRRDLLDTALKALVNAAYFLPVGWLLARVPAVARRGRGAWPAVLGVGLLVAGGVELMQLLVWSRFADATDVVTGALAVLAGWWAGRDDARMSHKALLGAWVAVLVFINWHPFNFKLSPGTALARLAEMSWVPFVDYYRGDYLNALDQFLEKTVLFLPVGALLAAGRGVRLPAAVGFGAGLAVLLETGQLLLPTRYASVTDVLVETGGTWLGFAVARRFGGRPRS
jgi:glycopeptide antibiotics resistance protein